MRRRARYWSGWATLALTSMLIATPAAVAQQVDVKGERELAGLGRKIDRAGASADAGRMISKIVEQWRGTRVRVEAAREPRQVTTLDVLHLRQKRLWYGEIAILLALTAKQPDQAKAKSLNEILAMRLGGSGWAQIARTLGYPSLGSVRQSVKVTEVGVERVAARARAEHIQAERMDRPPKR